MVVLDASALLAVLNREPGAEFVIAHMLGAQIKTANVATPPSPAKAGAHRDRRAA